MLMPRGGLVSPSVIVQEILMLFVVFAFGRLRFLTSWFTIEFCFKLIGQRTEAIQKLKIKKKSKQA